MTTKATDPAGEQEAGEVRVPFIDSSRFEFTETGQEVSGYVCGIDMGTDEKTGDRKPWYIRLLTKDRGVLRLPVCIALMPLCRFSGSPLKFYIKYTGAIRTPAGEMKQFRIDMARGKVDETTQLLLEAVKDNRGEEPIPF